MSLLTLYREVVSPFHNVIYQLERDGFRVDETVRNQLTKDTRSELKRLEKEIRDAATAFVSHWLPPLQSGELSGGCESHPDYRGKTKRAKCEGCVRVYQQAQRLRADARGLLAEQRRRWGAGFLGEFNIRSDAHWRRLLFDSHPFGLGLKANARRRTRKQKLVQIDKDAVMELLAWNADNKPACSILLLKKRFDTLEHDLSNFLWEVPEGVKRKRIRQPVDERGFAHTCYSLMTNTGRLSSGDDKHDPDKKRLSDLGNMQNIPDRLRRMYVADDDESVLVQADWRQVEALITAWLAGDEEMAGVILDGSRDIHSENALVLADAINFKGLTKENADEITFPNDPSGRSFRQAGKLTHKLHYGMGAEKFSRTYGISRQICQKIIDAYFGRWPLLVHWQKTTIEQASELRLLGTPFGRILHFWNFDRKGRLLDREEALAFRPQSIVGDMIKVVGVKLGRNVPDVGGRLVTTTHDSWTISANRQMLEFVVSMVKMQMEQPWPEIGSCGKLPTLWCPVDIAVGKNWGKFYAGKNEDGLRKWKASV